MKRKMSDRFRELSELCWGGFCGVMFFILLAQSTDDPISLIWFPVACLCLGILFGLLRRALQDREEAEQAQGRLGPWVR